MISSLKISNEKTLNMILILKFFVLITVINKKKL